MVSGLALGIDAVSHKGALEAEDFLESSVLLQDSKIGSTAAFLGSGKGMDCSTTPWLL